MAQKVQTFFVDDLDGSEAEGTVRFGLDGTEYEIDLNAKHARQLRDTLARYAAADSAPAPGGQPAADAKRSRTL
jgi:Lsr2